MSKYKLIILVVVIISITKNGYSQQSFKEVDSISFSLYSQQKWDELIPFGTRAINEGYDYFYLNLRMGIAYFYLKEYNSSTKMLKKAHKSNSYSQATIEYLYWDYYFLMKDQEALLWYNQLDDTTQNKINFEPGKKINSTYIEGGIKFSNSDKASNMSYFNVFLEHHLSGRFDVKESYSHYSQKLNWGNYNQHQIYLNPSFNINRKSKINIAFNGILYNSNLSFKSNNSYTISSSTTTGFFPLQTTTIIDSTFNNGYILNGTHQEHNIFIQPRYSIHWKYFGLSPNVTYYGVFQKPKYTETYTKSLTVRETQNGSLISNYTTSNDSINNGQVQKLAQYNVGIDVYANYKFLTIGSDFKYILNNGQYYFFYAPFIKVKLGKKMEFTSYYFRKKNYVVALFEGSNFINSYTNSTRISGTINLMINKNINTYFTYQNEKLFDNFNNQDYKFNSFYLGLKYKF